MAIWDIIRIKKIIYLSFSISDTLFQSFADLRALVNNAD